MANSERWTPQKAHEYYEQHKLEIARKKREKYLEQRKQNRGKDEPMQDKG